MALFQLPEASEALTKARIARKSGATARASRQRKSRHYRASAQASEGETQDFQDVPIEWAVGSFSCRVYEFIRRIPAGSTMTYGEIAKELGTPGSARAVGQRWQAIRCRC